MSSEPHNGRLKLAEPIEGAPAPSEKLRAAIAAMKPVATRAPGRDLAILALLSLLWCAAWLLTGHMRGDLSHLNPLWVGATLLAWLAGFVAPMAVAVLPPRGQVSPDGARAGLVTSLAVVALLVVAFVASPFSPGHTRVADFSDFYAHIPHCLARALLIGLGTISMVALALRRVVVSGGWRLGAAAGAAGGALGGMILEITCSLGGWLHVGFGHGLAVLVLAGLGALIVPRFMR